MPVKTLTLGFADRLTEVEIDVPEGEPRPWDATTKLAQVGKPTPRRDGHLKVSGKAIYTFDVDLPGMLHAVVLRCPLPCAKLSKISLERAASSPGVKAVLALAEAG
ncbi:MAG: hypothetical protein IAG13_32870, partial [Deltaproteobacteria bacterium]|nr:hypothetical protein [Nannocystaceae bacterium]